MTTLGTPNAKGGRYIIDPKTGKRRPATEKENAISSGEVVPGEKPEKPETEKSGTDKSGNEKSVSGKKS